MLIIKLSCRNVVVGAGSFVESTKSRKDIKQRHGMLYGFIDKAVSIEHYTDNVPMRSLCNAVVNKTLFNGASQGAVGLSRT